MNKYHLQVALVGLVSCGAGCTSAPVHYYTLTAPPPDQTSPLSQATLDIEVRVVHVPSELNRSELMVRAGPTEMTLLDNERWASPVNDEIKGAVRLELERRISRMPALRSDFTRLTLDIDVRRLEAELGRNALFQASWRAILSASGPRSDGTLTMSCTFQADERIPSGYAGMVEGYQREIAALADAIAAVLTHPGSGIEGSCQSSGH
jgi:uncharacterized protein